MPVNAVLIGKVRDKEGFYADLLEDPLTGARFLAYSVEDFYERQQYLTHLEAIGQSDRHVSDRDTFEVVHEKRTTHRVAD